MPPWQSQPASIQLFHQFNTALSGKTQISKEPMIRPVLQMLKGLLGIDGNRCMIALKCEQFAQVLGKFSVVGR